MSLTIIRINRADQCQFRYVDKRIDMQPRCIINCAIVCDERYLGDVHLLPENCPAKDGVVITAV